MPAEAAKLKERLDTYRQTLGTLGMRDYQVCKISLFIRYVFVRMDAVVLVNLLWPSIDGATAVGGTFCAVKFFILLKMLACIGTGVIFSPYNRKACDTTNKNAGYPCPGVF